MKHLSLLPIVAIVIALAVSCSTVDSDRIPPMNVHVSFSTIGDWERYGVSGAGQYRQFILTEKVPAGFPYKAADATGYGGLLLTMDPMGQPFVYDLACPYCAPAVSRIAIDSDAKDAGIFRCHKCSSTYDVFSAGTPLTGPAADKNNKFGLKRYRITISGSSPYALISY